MKICNLYRVVYLLVIDSIITNKMVIDVNNSGDSKNTNVLKNMYRTIFISRYN